mgnify:CR=1 FL=1
MVSFCKNLDPQGHQCGVEIEWREIDTPVGLRKRPFEVTSRQQHKCPYWKPTKTSAPANKPTFKPNDQLGRLAELETHMESKFMDLERRMRDVESVNKALQLQYGFIKGTKVQTTDVIEDEVVED